MASLPQPHDTYLNRSGSKWLVKSSCNHANTHLKVSIYIRNNFKVKSSCNHANIHLKVSIYIRNNFKVKSSCNHANIHLKVSIYIRNNFKVKSSCNHANIHLKVSIYIRNNFKVIWKLVLRCFTYTYMKCWIVMLIKIRTVKNLKW